MKHVPTDLAGKGKKKSSEQFGFGSMKWSLEWVWRGKRILGLLLSN